MKEVIEKEKSDVSKLRELMGKDLEDDENDEDFVEEEEEEEEEGDTVIDMETLKRDHEEEDTEKRQKLYHV